VELVVTCGVGVFVKSTILGLKALIKESIILGTRGSGRLIVPGIIEGEGVGVGIVKGLIIRFVGRGVGVLFVVLVGVGVGVGVGAEDPPEGAATVTVIVYIDVTPLAVTDTVIIFAPTFKEIDPEALPEETETPLTVTVPDERVGVTVID
jgi:hypothetical protein